MLDSGTQYPEKFFYPEEFFCAKFQIIWRKVRVSMFKMVRVQGDFIKIACKIFRFKKYSWLISEV